MSWAFWHLGEGFLRGRNFLTRDGLSPSALPGAHPQGLNLHKASNSLRAACPHGLNAQPPQSLQLAVGSLPARPQPPQSLQLAAGSLPAPQASNSLRAACPHGLNLHKASNSPRAACPQEALWRCCGHGRSELERLCGGVEAVREGCSQQRVGGLFLVVLKCVEAVRAGCPHGGFVEVLRPCGWLPAASWRLCGGVEAVQPARMQPATQLEASWRC